MLWLPLSLSPLTVTRSGGNDFILAKPIWQIIQLPFELATNPSNIWSLLVNFIEQIIYWKVLKCVCKMDNLHPHYWWNASTHIAPKWPLLNNLIVSVWSNLRIFTSIFVEKRNVIYCAIAFFAQIVLLTGNFWQSARPSIFSVFIDKRHLHTLANTHTFGEFLRTCQISHTKYIPSQLVTAESFCSTKKHERSFEKYI